MSRRAVTVPLPKGCFMTKRPSGEYWYHQTRRGKPDAGSITALGKYGSADFWKAVAGLSEAKDETPKNTFNALIDDHVSRLEAKDTKAGTMQTYRSALKHIRTLWGPLDPGAVTAADCLALQDTFSDRPSMANMIFGQLTALMKLAVQRGWRKDNPVREIDKLDEEPDSAQPIPPEAWAALMSDAAPEDLRRFAYLGRATGQRISDLVRMTPAGREEEGLNAKIKKLGDKLHWNILTQEQIAKIDGWNQFKGAAYVLRTDGKRHSPNSMRLVWNAFAATEAGATLKGFTPHDLRATKVCDERISGKTHQRISAMVEISLPKVMHYSKHIDKKAAARGT